MTPKHAALIVELKQAADNILEVLGPSYAREADTYRRAAEALAALDVPEGWEATEYRNGNAGTVLRHDGWVARYRDGRFIYENLMFKVFPTAAAAMAAIEEASDGR